MPKLPSFESLGQRPTVRSAYSPAAYAQVDNSGADALEKSASNFMEGVSNYSSAEARLQKEQEAADTKLQTAYAGATFLKGQLELEDKLKASTNYDEIEDIYNKESNKLLDTSSGLIKNEQGKQLFTAATLDSVVRGQQRMRELVSKGKQSISVANLDQMAADIPNLVPTARPEAKQALLNTFNAAVDANVAKNYITHEKAQEYRQKNYEKMAEVEFSLLPAEERVKALEGRLGQAPAEDTALTDFDSITNYIIDNLEGDQLVTDGNGAQAIYGINAEANPELFKDGKVPTRAEALAAYKEKYWDANKIGDLPPEMRLAAMDAVIQHGVGGKMIQKANGDPKRLIAMRRDYYETLPDYEKYGEGWMKRLDKVRTTTDRLKEKPSLVHLIPAEKIKKLLDDAQTEIRAQEALSSRQLEIAEKLKKQQQEKVMNDYYTKALKGELKVDDIINDKVLDTSQRRQMVEAIDRSVKNGDKTDPRTFNDLFHRIHASPGDPNRIVSVEQLNEFVGNGLSMEDLAKLRKEFDGSPQEQELRKQSIEAVRKKFLGKSDLYGIADPDGEVNYAHVLTLMQKAEEEGKKRGLSLTQLHDPASKEWVGNVANPFVKSDADRMAAAFSGTAPAKPPPINERVVDQIYQSPKGPMKWTGEGWLLVEAPVVPVSR